MIVLRHIKVIPVGPVRHRYAADFTLACIQATQRDPNAPWYGVEFEKALHLLPGLLER